MAVFQNITDRVGPSSPRTQAISILMCHTTEGNEAGDLAALTTNVSIHEYLPQRPKIRYKMVPANRVAYHAGWGKLGGASAPGPWLNTWNGISIGKEWEHIKGETWTPEQLTRILQDTRETALAHNISRLLRHQDIAAGRPGQVGNINYGGARTDPTNWPWWEAFAKICVLQPYTFKGPQDIGLDIWHEKLAAIMSEAERVEAYSMITERGYRAGPLLAMIGAESSYGTEGVATRTKNWGNVRSALNPSRVVETWQGWPVYGSWGSSLADVLDRLEDKGKPYFAQDNNDIALVRLHWAPVGDGTNDPFGSSYKQLQWITEWIRRTDPSTFHVPTNPVSPIGTYPVAEVLLEAWLASGGVWQQDRLTPGYALTPKFEHEGLIHQRYERGVARLNSNGSVSWLLSKEAERLPQ